jgi:hypothetical protein
MWALLRSSDPFCFTAVDVYRLKDLEPEIRHFGVTWYFFKTMRFPLLNYDILNYHPVPRRDSISRPITPQAEAIPPDHAARVFFAYKE